MNPDFIAVLRELSAADARFLVVGAYAVTFHSRPRATGDLGLWVEPTAENAARVFCALSAFGAPKCAFIGKPDLIRNKRALGRPRDLADLELLSE